MDLGLTEWFKQILLLFKPIGFCLSIASVIFRFGLFI